MNQKAKAETELVAPVILREAHSTLRVTARDYWKQYRQDQRAHESFRSERPVTYEICTRWSHWSCYWCWSHAIPRRSLSSAFVSPKRLISQSGNCASKRNCSRVNFGGASVLDAEGRSWTGIIGKVSSRGARLDEGSDSDWGLADRERRGEVGDASWSGRPQYCADAAAAPLGNIRDRCKT